MLRKRHSQKDLVGILKGMNPVRHKKTSVADTHADLPDNIIAAKHEGDAIDFENPNGGEDDCAETGDFLGMNADKSIPAKDRKVRKFTPDQIGAYTPAKNKEQEEEEASAEDGDDVLAEMLEESMAGGGGDSL